MNQPNSALELYWYIPPRGNLTLEYLIKVSVVVVFWGECYYFKQFVIFCLNWQQTYNGNVHSHKMIIALLKMRKLY